MKNKEKRYHSFKEFKKEFDKGNQEKIELKKILRDYGVDIPLEQIDNIEIEEKDQRKISYFNKKTNEIITSNLYGKIYEKWQERYSVSLTKSNLEKDFFVEHFHSIKPVNTWKEAGKNALKSRNNSKNKLLSRAYKDVSTKYGDFCLHIEENYTDYKFGPYQSISLYYGNHEQVLEKYKNDFDFNKYCLLRWKFMNQNNFDQWMMGYVNEYFTKPKLNFWNFGDTEKKDLPIFSVEDYENFNSGTILFDGKLKIKDNYKYLPQIFDYFKIEKQLMQYENSNLSSKAYFCNYSNFVAIQKKDSEICIEYRKENYITKEWEECFSSKIVSLTAQEFTQEDFLNIIIKINNSPINSELKKFIISSLTAYLNIHDKKDFKTIKRFTLKPYKFDDLLQVLKQSDLEKLIEKKLESLSDTFSISLEEILGKNPPNQIKQSQYVKRIK